MRNLVATLLLLLTLAVVCPSGEAGVEGSQSDPELVDPPNDIEYSVVDPVRDSPHIDVTKVWVSADPEKDLVIFAIEVVNGAGFETMRIGSAAGITVYADLVAQGERVGLL